MGADGVRVNLISIHAPPRGATAEKYEITAIGYISIHAPPRGATAGAHAGQGDGEGISIHAPPRGATEEMPHIARQHPTDFNSRPSARGDVQAVAALIGVSIISIHAPPRGATATAKAR